MAQYYAKFNETLEGYLKEKNKVTDLLEKIEKATGVKRLYIAQGILGFVGLYMIVGHFAALVANLVGFIYPAYKSIQALESHGADDDTKWLTYWVVYAFFSTIEFFSDIIFSWFPFYWLAKVVFLIWCFLPISGNGSMVVYHRFIRPIFLKNKSKIESAVDSAVDQASGLVGKAILKNQ
ncbi:Receptor expression-enhancing protein 5 [Halotydeus destructor]|nr:Receptor expression-enhancing protein 5 [Halotydeus destructor]